MTRQEYEIWGAKATCKRGNDLPQAKLNPDLVREIRANRHGWTAKQWAQKLGLHERTITGVRERTRWGHV